MGLAVEPRMTKTKAERRLDKRRNHSKWLHEKTCAPSKFG
jgi:hypothetical protein